MRAIVLIALLSMATAVFADANTRGVSLKALPAGLTVGQAAQWITEGTCLVVVMDADLSTDSLSVLDTPVDYTAFSLRDFVSIDTALLLISPPHSTLIVDRDNGFITYRPTQGAQQ